MTLEESAELLRNGEVVAFPTETVYGLGADAWNPDAIRKIFAVKGRPDDNPLIVHLSDRSQVLQFAANIPAGIDRLMDSCWPGPLTLVFKKRPDVLDLITAGLPTIALRIPNHPSALSLIRLTGPLVAPSANRSGRPSPTRAEHVYRDFGSGFPVLEGDDPDLGLESTVLDITRKPFVVLRPGRFTFRELETISGTRVVAEPLPEGRPASPGIKYTHYKPAAKVMWYDGDESPLPDRNNTLLITHTHRPDGFTHHRHYNRDFDLLARNLYDHFRTADYHNLNTVAIEKLPNQHAHPFIAALKNRIEKAIG